MDGFFAKRVNDLLFPQKGSMIDILFFLEPVSLCQASMFFFLSIWASSVLIHSCSNEMKLVYLAITSHLACWKSQKFPISEGKNFFERISPNINL